LVDLFEFVCIQSCINSTRDCTEPIPTSQTTIFKGPQTVRNKLIILHSARTEKTVMWASCAVQTRKLNRLDS